MYLTNKVEGFWETESDDALTGQKGKWGKWYLNLCLSHVCPPWPWFHCGSHMASNSLLSSHWELSVVEFCQSPSWFNDMEKSAAQCSPSTDSLCPWLWFWSQQAMLGIEPAVPQMLKSTCALTPAAVSLCARHINESCAWGPTIEPAHKKLPKDKKKSPHHPSNLACRYFFIP